MKKTIYFALFAILCASCSVRESFLTEENDPKSELQDIKTEINSGTSVSESPATDNSDKTVAFGGEAHLHNAKPGAEIKKPNFENLLPQKQYFSIDPQKEQLIKTASGTTFIIPAYSFPGTAAVDVSIREYFSKESAFVQNLTTVTTSGEILESAGMFHIEAFSNGRKIDLVPGAEIIIEAAAPVASDMGIYYGVNDENGDVIWDYDSLGTTPNPVIVLEAGRFKKTSNQIFVEQYRLEKETMLKLQGSSWSTDASFDTEGNIIGQTLCEGQSSPKAEACRKFFELMSTLDPGNFKTNFQLHSVDFKFRCLSRREYQQRMNAEKVRTELGKAFENFEKAADGRKYFSIRSLGFINIDREIPLPDFKSRADVLVKATETAAENIKLIFSDSKTILSPKLEKGNFVFKNIPVGTGVNIVAAYAKGDKIYAASQKMTVKKQENNAALIYAACSTEDFGAKLADLCN